MKSNKVKKFITVKTSGPLPELGHITGPVIHPWWVDVEKVVTLIHNGRKVYEVNPNNKEERVLLTLKNVRLNNFAKEVKEPQVVSAPKVETPTKVDDKKPVETKKEVTKEVAEPTKKEEVKAEEPKVETKPQEEKKSDFTKK